MSEDWAALVGSVRVNNLGRDVALGFPIGMSRSRVLFSLMNVLKRTGAFEDIANIHDEHDRAVTFALEKFNRSNLEFVLYKNEPIQFSC